MIRRNKLKALTVYLIMISSLCFCINDYARANSQIEQYFTVNNNGTVLAKASLKEITRIAFNHEVTDINAIVGELEYAVNGKDIYLRTSSEKPINFFVKLEGGWTFKFILGAEDIPANQIFVNNGASRILAQTNNKLSGLSKISEQVSPLLKKRIEKIIAVSLRPKKHIGYEIVAKDKSLTSQNKDLTMQLVGTINGDMLKAEKIQITNKSNETKKLALNDFMSKERLAVYLTKTLLSPSEQSVLIRISEN